MIRGFVVTFVVALAWMPSLSMAEKTRSLREVFKQVDPSVVVVETNRHQVVTGPKMQLATMPGLGSGVLISSDGMVMTAAHGVNAKCAGSARPSPNGSLREVQRANPKTSALPIGRRY